MANNSTSRSRQTQIGTLAAIVIFAAALFARFVLGIDLGVFDHEQTQTPVVTVPPTAVPTAEPTPLPGPTVLTPIPGGYDGGWFQVYFTSPINTQDASRFVGAPLENALVKALDGARQSIDAALYELNSQFVTDALIRAHDRGVIVRVVMDGEYGLEDPESTADQLELAGIDVRSDGSRNGFMHNKFFVIDSQWVWTGSTNVTHNDIYNNNNNSLLIRSSRLAANYTTEFEELFNGQFGITSPKEIPYPGVTVDGTLIQTEFEAEGYAPERLIKLLASSHTVRFMTFSFTRSDIFDALIHFSQVGLLDVQGIVEASSRQFVSPLFCAGIDVRQDGNPDVLHHKVFIIDNSIVVTGSFNFTNRAADNNDENMLIIYNEALARAYLEEYDKRWAEAKEMPVSAFKCQ